MKTDTSDGGGPGSGPALSASTIFELLVEDRRRYALSYLSRKVGAVPVDELAEGIALREGEPTRDRFERVSTGLHHVHLPKLAAAGVVRYDPVAETVELVAATDQFGPYLELADADER